jgi:hypothetical protein
MKVTTTILLLLAATVILHSGCSPSIKAWADRGAEGLTLEQANVTSWYEMAVAQTEKEKQDLVDAAFADIRLGLAGGIKRPDGTAVKIDEAWLATSQKALLAGLEAVGQRRKKLDEMYTTNMTNIGRTREAFEQIQRLNKVYIGSQNELAAQVAKLTSLVQSMQQERK